MMPLFQELTWRGLIYQTTHPAELEARLNQGGQSIYIGFDPTADSLHIGSLLPLLMLRRLQQAGHRVIALVGGATGFVGDPSGKSQERSLLSQEQLEHNLAGIRAQVERLVDLAEPRGILRNNHDWIGGMSFIDFLRDVGKRVSVNAMLEKESVRHRLENRDQGISFTEFSYMLMQAYDFLHLYRAEGCTIQLGGSDQWGNITLGMDLIRRTTGGEAFGLTFPLLTRSDGSKFGKSERGNVWLSPQRTSPYQFYQFLLQIEDADVARLLRFLTFLPPEEIEALEIESRERPDARTAQRRLATEVTGLVHSPADAQRAEHASHALFGESLRDLDERTLLEVFAEAPSSVIARDRFEGEGLSIVDLLVETGLAASRGAARRELAGGGYSLNQQRLQEQSVGLDRLLFGRLLVLRKGKKVYHLVRVE